MSQNTQLRLDRSWTTEERKTLHGDLAGIIDANCVMTFSAMANEPLRYQCVVREEKSGELYARNDWSTFKGEVVLNTPGLLLCRGDLKAAGHNIKLTLQVCENGLRVIAYHDESLHEYYSTAEHIDGYWHAGG